MIRESDPGIILFFTAHTSLADWVAGGVAARETALYRRLAAAFGPVVFATWGGSADRRLAAGMTGIRVATRPAWLPARYTRAWLARFAARVRGPAVVKSNQVRGADVAAAFARRRGLPFVARCGYLHSDFEARAHGDGSPRAREALDDEGRVFRAADRVVVTAEWMRGYVVDRHGIDADRIFVIPNYVETDRHRPPDGGRDPRAIAFVGRLAEQKNVPLLLEAVAGLPVRLDLVGDGPLRADLERRAREAGIDATFHGNVSGDRVAEIVARAAVFVLPSRYEGHPKALLEAMSAATPVVATAVSGSREVVRDGETGRLVPEDAAAIRGAVVGLLDDDALRARLGAAARAFVLETLSLDRVVERETELLRAVVGGGA